MAVPAKVKPPVELSFEDQQLQFRCLHHQGRKRREETDAVPVDPAKLESIRNTQR